MRRIFGLLCMQNEADRFLRSCLEWNTNWFDDLFVYDDRSTDRSVRIAADYGVVVVRNPSDPSFLDHEGQFRSHSWSLFEDIMNPTEEDWIISFDADEFIVSNLDSTLTALALQAEQTDHRSVALHVPEVWNDTPPYLIRTDGFWNENWNPRFCRYDPVWNFNDRSMGCGSVPSYAFDNPLRTIAEVELLHFGYSESSERQRRYIRYSQHTEGHNPVHIQSIVGTPVLTPWVGPTPNVWEGER